MFRVIACIYEQHDLWLVAVAALVCIFSWTAALQVFDRVATANERNRHLWLLIAGAAAGGGTWATHFIAMLAFAPSLPVGFSLPMTLLSAVIGVAGGWAALETHRAMRGPNGIIAAGLILALGMVGLHFVGMAGVQAAARQVWSVDLLVASLLMVSVFAIAGFATLSRGERGRIASCALFVGSVVSLHFTAMGALTLVPDPRLAPPLNVLDRTGLAIIVTFGSSMLVVLTAVAAFADRRIVQERMLRAEESDRAKSRFIANMSHELRTPLNAIIGYSELIAETSMETMTVADAERVHVAANHLLALVNDMLDLAKIDANRLMVRRVECDVGSLLEEICELMRPAAAARRNKLVVALGAQLPPVLGDPLRIKQCLLNFVSNAAKFTEDGVIRLEAQRVGDGVEITVSDTGIGMSAEQMQRLFKPFVQADASIAHNYGGTGLGLSVTKGLAELMHGDVAVASALGKGAKFTLLLPAGAVDPVVLETAAA